MKRLYFLLGLITSSAALHAQEPVAWTFKAMPLGGQFYEVHIRAKILKGYHIYAQHQPPEAVAIPTSIVYTNNPWIQQVGPIREKGNLVHYRNAAIDVAQDQYADSVDFVTKIRIKAPVNTRIVGSLTYQACNEEQCFPAKEEAISIELSTSAVSK